MSISLRFSQKFCQQIERAGIPYWVYGGIAVAGIAGQFIRPSPTVDVDIFVFEEDFERTRWPSYIKLFCWGGRLGGGDRNRTDE